MNILNVNPGAFYRMHSFVLLLRAGSFFLTLMVNYDSDLKLTINHNPGSASQKMEPFFPWEA